MGYEFTGPAAQLAFLICCGLFLLLLLETCLFGPSHDTVAGWMQRLPVPGPVWFVIWALSALVLGVVMPVKVGHGDLEWFRQGFAQITTIFYVLLVPALLWAYLTTLEELRRFFNKANLDALGIPTIGGRVQFWTLERSGVLNFLSNVILLILTFFAMRSVLCNAFTQGEILHNPWICNGALTWAGYLYYVAVRGLNAYLGMGLLMMVLGMMAVFYFGLKSEDLRKLVGDGKGMPGSTRRLVNRISLCWFTGALVISSYGLAHILKTKSLLKSGLSYGEIFPSVWTYWVFSFGVISVLLFFAIWALNEIQTEVIDEAGLRMRERIYSLLSSEVNSLLSYNVSLEALNKIDQYVGSIGPSNDFKRSLVIVAASLFIQLIPFLIDILG